MSSVTFNPDTRHAAKIANGAILVTIALSVSLLAVFVPAYRVNKQDSIEVESEPSWAGLSPEPDTEVWKTFFRRKNVGMDGNVSENYRLAGPYFEFGASHSSRKAIVDDIKAGRQHIIREGQTLNDVLILSIASDHVLVRAPSGAEEQLWLSFRSADAAVAGTSTNSTVEASEGEPDAFGGRRVGENRWVFSREGLMDYYTDLMSEPERLVKLFDSFKPNWTEDGQIDGYEIEVFGENQFFESIGLHPNDRVMTVNSLKMSNRRRAEYLISEFVANRVNVVVMDIERDGKPQKLIYQIR